MLRFFSLSCFCVFAACCCGNNDLKKSCIPSTGTSETKLFSQDEIKLIEERVRHQMTFKRYKGGYFINGYAILFSIQTGMRVAEICSLKWEDISDSDIHIHSQQLHSADTGKYNYANWTKNERGRSQGGRYFPLTEKIKDILIELTLLQKKLGISSEFVFCNLNGEWMKAEAYESTLRRICQRLNFKVTNNHAFRMSLNSNIFIPLRNACDYACWTFRPWR